MRRLHFRIGSCWIVALVLAVMAWDIGITSSYASPVPSANSTAMPRLRGVQFAQVSTLSGKWDIVWKGARDTYTGTLEITRKADANLYLGKVTLSPSNGGTVIQDARITTSSGELHIECSNPREPSGARRNYNPDRFFVTLSGNRMAAPEKATSLPWPGRMSALTIVLSWAERLRRSPHTSFGIP